MKSSKLEVNSKNKHGRTPLHFASWKGHVDIMALLITAVADIDATDHYGATPLHMSAIQGNTEAIEFLLSKGANPELKDCCGETALDWAITRRDFYGKDSKAVEILTHLTK